MRTSTLLLLVQFLPIVLSAPALEKPTEHQYNTPVEDRAASGYAPIKASCPDTSLVRAAEGLSKIESKWLDERKTKASANLEKWLRKHGFEDLDSASMPTLGLATSGGGFRSLLVGGGVRKAFDARDSDTTTSGLLGAFSYESALSGGSLLLTSITGNSWPTISNLTDTIWKNTIPDSPLVPRNLVEQVHNLGIDNDLLAKKSAGFDPTIMDPYGRLFSYVLLNGTDGGVKKTTSGLSTLHPFQNHDVPYPIITAINVLDPQGGCATSGPGKQFEFAPFESGSWDKGIAAFTNTQYLGTAATNGAPDGACITNYDNQGYIAGTSANVYADFCVKNHPGLLSLPLNLAQNTLTALTSLIGSVRASAARRDVYGTFPNPFKGYKAAFSVSDANELSLVDGGAGGESVPLWPMLHRPVDVIVISDNNDDSADGFPTGTTLHVTYQNAKKAGVKGMPKIPGKHAIARARGNGKGPLFFGCNDPNAKTLIWLPNQDYSYEATGATLKWAYSPKKIEEYIKNGMNVATHGNDKNWGMCLGCGLMKKSGQKLPDACGACFDKYCFN